MNPQSPSTPHSPNPPAPRISKLLFCWLALLGGWIGAHWIYAGRKRFWFYIGFTPLSAFAGWIDCMRFGLMPDEQFNDYLNPDHPRNEKQSSGLTVTAVALSLAVAVTALMSLLAILFQLMIDGTVA